MFNKTASLFVLSLAAMGLASCGGGDNADLTYWCPTGDNAVMTELVNRFKASKAEYANLNIKLGANYGEGDTYAALHKDLDKAADVILMADNNIRSGVLAEELAEIKDEAYKATVSEEATRAMSVKGKVYGYAYRADNSPMPIYDSSLLGEADVQKIETVLAKSKLAGKKVYLDFGNGWYNPFLLWCGGGDFHINDAGKLATNVGGTGSAKAGVAKSLEAWKALYNTYKDVFVSSSDSALIEAGFKSKTISYAFLWNDMANITPNNADAKVAKWPTVTIDSKEVKMECFASYKAVVCKENSNTERLTLAKAFASFISNQASQELRLDQLGYGPSNLELLKSAKVGALPFVKKITEMQNELRTHPQALSTTDDFWTPMGNLGGLVINGKAGWGDYASASKALDALVSNQGWVVEEIN